LSGPKIQAVSLELCRLNLVHFVASDAHNLFVRPFGLRQAYGLVFKEAVEWKHFTIANENLLRMMAFSEK
jgi:tyrosine-protein phosphatase YwqE